MVLLIYLLALASNLPRLVSSPVLATAFDRVLQGLEVAKLLSRVYPNILGHRHVVVELRRLWRGDFGRVRVAPAYDDVGWEDFLPPAYSSSGVDRILPRVPRLAIDELGRKGLVCVLHAC